MDQDDIDDIDEQDDPDEQSFNFACVKPSNFCNLDFNMLK